MEKKILARNISVRHCALDMICIWSGTALLLGLWLTEDLIVHTNNSFRHTIAYHRFVPVLIYTGTQVYHIA